MHFVSFMTIKRLTYCVFVTIYLIKNIGLLYIHSRQFKSMQCFASGVVTSRFTTNANLILKINKTLPFLQSLVDEIHGQACILKTKPPNISSNVHLEWSIWQYTASILNACLLYTSDAADE